MRTHGLRCLIAAGLFAAVSGGARADLIAVEDFESYGAPVDLAGLNGPGGWIGAWSTSGSGVTRRVVDVSGNPLSYAAGDINIDGGNRALELAFSNDANQVFAGRQLPAQSDTLYLSFLYRPVEDDGGNFLQFGFLNSVSNPTGSVIDTGNAFQVRAGTSGSTTSGIASDLDSVYLLVLRLEDTTGGAAYDRMSLAVNPTSSNEGLQTFVSATSADVLNLSSNAYFVIRRAFHDAGDLAQVDNLRIASTFKEVVGIPEPSTLVMLVGLVAAGLLGCFRSRRAAR